MRWNMHSVSNICTLDGKNPRTSPGQCCCFIDLFFRHGRGSLSLSSSHFHRIPDSHSANGSCVRFIPPLEALELRVRSACIIDGTSSCPPDFHSYFVKLVEVPSQERKKQSLSNRSSTLCHCHGKRARVAKSKELEVVSIGLDAQ